MTPTSFQEAQTPFGGCGTGSSKEPTTFQGFTVGNRQISPFISPVRIFEYICIWVITERPVVEHVSEFVSSL